MLVNPNLNFAEDLLIEAYSITFKNELPVQRFTLNAKTIGGIPHLQVDYQGGNLITQDIAALIKDASM